MGMNRSVKLVNIYGTNQAIKKIEFGFITMPVGVVDYPSDGVIYVHSASYVKGLLRRGATLLAQKGLDKNHLQLAMHEDVHRCLLDILAK